MNNIKKRFVSLDVLRGLTIIGMILVNAQGPGDKFECLIHSSWNGCILADFVFPFFLFIVGAAVRFAFRKNNYQLDKAVTIKILKRGFFIFLIGFLLNIYPFIGNAHNWRILGVLQRIAVVYVATAFLVMWLKSFQKILVLSIVILLGYWAVMYFGGSTPEHNFTMVVDSFLLGNSHLYTGAFDPEGLVSNVPAIVNGLFGYLAATVLTSGENHEKSMMKLGTIGISMICIGLLWNFILPFNKSLWSSSFVVYICGWASLLWAVTFWILDVKGWKGWTGFFLVFGSNALVAYILSELFILTNYAFPFTINGEHVFVSNLFDQYVYSAITMTKFRSVLWGLTILFLCWAIAYPLYKKKIFIKL